MVLGDKRRHASKLPTQDTWGNSASESGGDKGAKFIHRYQPRQRGTIVEVPVRVRLGLGARARIRVRATVRLGFGLVIRIRVRVMVLFHSAFT